LSFLNQEFICTLPKLATRISKVTELCSTIENTIPVQERPDLLLIINYRKLPQAARLQLKPILFA